MDLNGFIDIDLKNEEQYREFLDLNAIAHQTIHNTLLEAGFVVAQYPLYTMAGIDKDWLLVHASEHRAWSSVLSLGDPPDIDSANFDDQRAMDDWLTNHALHHSLVAQTLGL